MTHLGGSLGFTCLSFFHTGKATDVGGPVSEISGAARPPFQHHATQSQEVTCYFISSLGRCWFQHLLFARGEERAGGVGWGGIQLPS